jgi:excisionase family DNA binding protein
MARAARPKAVPLPATRRVVATGPALHRADPPPRYDDLPDLCTPDDACAFLQVSRNTVYELLKTGAIPSVKYGRQIRIHKPTLLPPTVTRD